MTVNEIRKGLLSDHASYLCELDRQIIHQAIECEGRVKALMEDVTKLTETIEQLSKDNTDLREKVKRLTKEIGERDKEYFYENIFTSTNGLSTSTPRDEEPLSDTVEEPLEEPLEIAFVEPLKDLYVLSLSESNKYVTLLTHGITSEVLNLSYKRRLPEVANVEECIKASLFVMKFLFHSQQSIFRNETSIDMLNAACINWDHAGKQSTENFHVSGGLLFQFLTLFLLSFRGKKPITVCIETYGGKKRGIGIVAHL